MIDTLRVLQWNAARSLAAIHSLTPLIANNPQPPHLLLIQEPPWYQIGTQPSLTDAAGTPIFNVPSIAGYTPCLPPTTPPRVVTVRPSPEALRGTSLEMPGPDRGPPYLPEHAYKANRKSV